MKTQIKILLICIASFCAAYKLTPRQLLADKSPINLETMIPEQVSGWHVVKKLDDQIISSPELDAKVSAIYSQLLNRTYVSSDGYQIMLSVAYTKNQSDNSGQQSHKPEICYPAQGFEILHRQQTVLRKNLLPVIQLETQNQQRHELVSYFTTIGNLVVSSNMETKIAQMKYSIDGVIPDGLIFRVSSVDRDSVRAYKKQEEFIDGLFASASEEATRILPIKVRH